MITQQLALPDGQVIPYQLCLRPRRTVGLKITASGLVVHAPHRLPAAQLVQVLQDKAHWIQSKLALRAAMTEPPMQWQSGEALWWMGQSIVLALQPGGRQQAVRLEGSALVVPTPEPDNPALTARKVLQWYQRQALPDFSRRVQLVATQMGETVNHIALSNARARWGSCNSRREIRLNWRLIQAPPQLIQYVVCHEMAHLREMNHSARFYAELRALYADYPAAEAALKQWSNKLHRMA